MSRTYKDRHWKIRFGWMERDLECEKLPYEVPYRKYNPTTGEYETTDDVVIRYVYLERAGTKPKLKRQVNNHYAWYSATPSWWTRLHMNRPQRRKGHLWERKALFEDIEDSDPPGVGRKPHKYYW